MKRVAIFAGYDKHGIIDDYVLYYLKELKKHADIVFVNDTEFSDEELEKVKDLTIHQICKTHSEYDFGSYKRGYAWLKEQNLLENYDQLIFCNDSVYGPFYDLGPIFEEMQTRENNDFWSIFFERDYSYAYTKRDYAQSYFLVFNQYVFTTDVFSDFLSNVTKLEDKSKIIELYELGITQTLLNNGFKCDGYISSPYNAPHDRRAMQIIKDGFPFIKRSLFDRKAFGAKCAELCDYEKIISSNYPDFDTSLMNKHIERVFDKDDIKYVLSRKLDNFNFHILHRKFIRIKGIFTKKEKYKFSIAILGLTIFKFMVPKKHTCKK